MPAEAVVETTATCLSEPSIGSIRSIRWRDRNQHQALFHAAKYRAGKRGAPFEIVPDDIVIPSHCPVLGLELVRARGAHAPNSASLDRIVPSLGYVPGNVLVVSWRANSLKKDATPDELRKIADFYTNLERQAANEDPDHRHRNQRPPKASQ